MTVADSAYLRLRGAIVRGQLPPGMPLPEIETADALGVSRTPVRQALNRLELEGFIHRGHNGRLAVLRLDPRQIGEIFGLRIDLECHGAALAARRVSKAEIARLERLVDSGDDALASGDITRLASVNQELHDVILEASRNQVLVDLVLDLRTRLVATSLFAVGEESDRRRFMREHARLNVLLSVGDAVGAKALLRAHLERARDLLLEGYRRPELSEDLSALMQSFGPERPMEEPASLQRQPSVHE